MLLPVLATIALLALHQAATAEWSVETVRDKRSGRQITRILLPELGGRATLVIQCAKPSADAIVYLREPADGSHLKLIYRFDDDEPQSRMAAVSPSGHVLRIWNEAEKQAFSHSQRLRSQQSPSWFSISIYAHRDDRIKAQMLKRPCPPSRSARIGHG